MPDTKIEWVYAVGYNTVGDMPNPDNVHYYADYEQAITAYQQMARDFADEDDNEYEKNPCGPMSGPEDYGDFGTMRATVDAIMKDGDDVWINPYEPGEKATGNRNRGMIVADNEDCQYSFWFHIVERIPEMKMEDEDN